MIMRQRMAKTMSSNRIEEGMVRACYHLQKCTPVPIDENFNYGTFLEMQNEFNHEKKEEEKQAKGRKTGLGR